jgi:chromosome segregation ATPase
MVFGWGKKDKGKKLEEPTQNQISVDDVPKIIDDFLSIRTNHALSEIKSLRDATNPLIEELVKIGKTLEKDNLNVDEIDKPLRVIVVRGKKQVIDVIKKDVSELPHVSTFEDAEHLNTILHQILKKIGDVLGRQTRVIHIFAKKYADKLKEILAQMNSNHSKIKQLIKQFNDTKITSDEIFDLLKTITVLEDEIEQKEHRIPELKLEIDSLENKMTSLKSSIDKIKSSSEYGSYLQLNTSLDRLASERLKIKDQIDSQFTKISRPLSRYEYVSSDKEQKKLLKQLVEDPIEVLTPENKDFVIVILENIRKGILSYSISVKDIDKSMVQITETVEMLDSFITQVEEFKQKVNDIKNQLNKFDRKDLIELEKELEKTSKEKEDHDQKISVFENELRQSRLQIPVLLTTMESKLQQFTNTQYDLKKS